MDPQFESLLREFSPLSSGGEQVAFLARNPIAFKAAYMARREGQVAHKQAADRILAIANWLFENPHAYPIGQGPIEQLAQQIENGQVSPEQAEAVARSPGVQDVAHPWYIWGLCRYALDLALASRWRDALLLHRITLAAVESMPSPPGVKSRGEAAAVFLQIASSALMTAPDGRLYRRAVELAERSLAEVEGAGEKDVAGEIYHNLGVLRLDPYTAGRSSQNYGFQIQVWKARLVDELGEEYYATPAEELRMPEPADALTEAERCFRLALGLRTGRLKGLTLKALAQTLEWRHFLGANIQKRDIARLSEDALSLLDPESDAEIYASAQAILKRNGGALRDDGFSNLSFDDLVATHGLSRAFWMVNSRVSTHLESDPLPSLKLLHASVKRAWEVGMEEVLRQQLNLELTVLPRVLGRNQELKFLFPNTARRLRQARKIAARDGWDDQALAATLFGIALSSSQKDEEEEGLSLLEEIIENHPSFAEEYWQAMVFLRGILHVGVGSNAFNARRLADAVEAYGLAIADFLKLRLDTESMDSMLRIEDLIDQNRQQVAEKAITVLSLVALPFESRQGANVTLFLQRNFKKLMVGLLQEGKIKSELIWLLWHTAKGQRMSASLRRAPIQYSVQQDERGRELLDEIGAMERKLREQPAIAGPKDYLLDEEMLLGAYSRPAERQSGDTEEEQWTNLQHAYEHHLTSIVLGSTTELETFYLDLEQTQRLLDERTVLINYYLGASPHGTVSIYSAVLTRQEVRFFGVQTNFPDPILFTLGGDDISIAIHPESLSVEALRSSIQMEPPRGRAVLPEAQDQLAAEQQRYLGPEALNFLRTLRDKGKDHLCIVPHGPLHFYPFHLLGKQEDLLGSQWIITYLPNLQLLTRVQDKLVSGPYDSSRSRVFGVSFQGENSQGMSELPSVPEEVEVVAKTLDVHPVLDAAATKREFLRALAGARWMHLATHGTYRAVAPAFQCLHLAQDQDSDGRVAAYEILGLDLKGLDLLTLSACETALGRFDQGDNLLGLPASFFLAGASTIVGTLWPIYDLACQTFFTALYTGLHQGLSKLDAFAAAQRQTRTGFPEYRDWGAFYLMGSWT